MAAADGWHELAVANPTFLLERLGSECTDLQGLRELTVNGLDAIAALGADRPGRVVWDLDWERFDGSGGRVRKLSVIDTGTGMTAEQLRHYINQLAASGREQSSRGNFGVGAKVAAGSRNPHGLEYRSWQEGARFAGVLQAPPRRAMGARAAAVGGRPRRLLATAGRSGEALASARPGSRHPGRSARPARAARHHAGAAERHRRPAALDHPLPRRPLPPLSRRRSRSSCANTTAPTSTHRDGSTASSTTSSTTPSRQERWS